MRTFFTLLLLLAGCASPSVEYFSAQRHDLQVEGIDFAVFVKADAAEVIRLGYLTRAQRRPVPDLMRQAAEQASGCLVIPDSMKTRLPGDTGEARFHLDCVPP